MPIYPLRVIVLEDHPFLRSVAVTMLRRLGCKEVFEAADGTQALDVLSRVGPVDIALCDLQMDGMDGVEFFQQISDSTLVKAVIINSSITADLRRTVKRLINLLRLDLLGDIGKPLKVDVLELMLKKYMVRPVVSPVVEEVVKVVEVVDESEVHRAFAAKEFRSYFQPKFILNSGEIKGVEVLARWEHPSKGVLPPSSFLPVLENCDLLDEFLFDQLQQSLKLQRYIKEQGKLLNIAFNLQASQLKNHNLACEIKVLMAAYGSLGSTITFELTESGLLEVPVKSLENLYRLRMLGCLLSIDDFGAGFSSLLRLCQLPFNEIKLDSEFVRSIDQEPPCQAAISSTLALGRSLGMSVVIEGIETDEQRVMLLALGCTVGQGYFFARPMTGGDLLHRLNLPQMEGRLDMWINDARKKMPLFKRRK